MMCTRIVQSLVLAFAAVASSAAAESPLTRQIRIETVRPGALTELVGVPGFITTIEFGEEEHIENIAIGDGSQWQITPNRRGSLVFVKPLARSGTTNMTVVTDHNVYNFLLRIQQKSEAKAIFYLKIRPPIVLSTLPQQQNLKLETESPVRTQSVYTYNGSPRFVPLEVFDDGTSTYFRFQSDSELPAIFVNETPKTEAIVNSAFRGGYVVVDQIARQFSLRRGNEVTNIVNASFVEPAPGPASPAYQKRAKK